MLIIEFYVVFFTSLLNKNQLRDNLDINVALELVYYLVEKTVHDAMLNQRDPVKQNEVIVELKIMVLTYLIADVPE